MARAHRAALPDGAQPLSRAARELTEGTGRRNTEGAVPTAHVRQNGALGRDQVRAQAFALAFAALGLCTRILDLSRIITSPAMTTNSTSGRTT